VTQAQGSGSTTLPVEDDSRGWSLFDRFRQPAVAQAFPLLRGDVCAHVGGRRSVVSVGRVHVMASAAATLVGMHMRGRIGRVMVNIGADADEQLLDLLVMLDVL
jgi:hypothetical protein